MTDGVLTRDATASKKGRGDSYYELIIIYPKTGSIFTNI
jgi:hypothetical protein